MELLGEIQDWLLQNNVSFCDFAYDLSGVLTDQATYYLSSVKDITQGLEWRAEEISDVLTL